MNCSSKGLIHFHLWGCSVPCSHNASLPFPFPLHSWAHITLPSSLRLTPQTLPASPPLCAFCLRPRASLAIPGLELTSSLSDAHHLQSTQPPIPPSGISQILRLLTAASAKREQELPSPQKPSEGALLLLGERRNHSCHNDSQEKG